MKFSEYKKFVELADLSTKRCRKNCWTKEALGNLKFLHEKYKDCTRLYLAACRENNDPALLARLVYSLVKCEAH
jgi:hypothetical protein